MPTRVRIAAAAHRIFRVSCDVAWLRKFGVSGIVIGRRILFALPADRLPETTFRHELQHAYQMVRDGFIRFTIKYLWYQMRYGYQDNPYEIEARDRAEEPLSPEEEQLLWKLRENSAHSPSA